MKWGQKRREDGKACWRVGSRLGGSCGGCRFLCERCCGEKPAMRAEEATEEAGAGRERSLRIRSV